MPVLISLRAFDAAINSMPFRPKIGDYGEFQRPRLVMYKGENALTSLTATSTLCSVSTCSTT